jgi:hypothetical protein
MTDSTVIPVNLYFDVDKIVEVYHSLEDRIKETMDKQVSITSRNGNDLSEGIGKIADLIHPEKDYDILNDIFKDTYIEYVHNTLLNYFPVVRGRIMLLLGKTCYTYHRDPTWRLHIPVLTNKDSILIIEDRIYKLQNLGQVYLVNTKLFHTAVNMKFEDRVHLVYGLNSDDPAKLASF